MIVFDVSALVGAPYDATGCRNSPCAGALDTDRIAVSEPVLAELLDVFARPRLRRFVRPEMRDGIVSELFAHGVFFTPEERVTDCRDSKDNMYLELALASGSGTIVSSDGDLLVLHPWRSVRILRSAEYLREAVGDA